MYQYHLLVRELGNLVLESCVKLLVIMSALSNTICLNTNCSDINRGIQEHLWLWFYISWHKIETSACLLWHKISWSTVKRKVKQLDKPENCLIPQETLKNLINFFLKNAKRKVMFTDFSVFRTKLNIYEGAFLRK